MDQEEMVMVCNHSVLLMTKFRHFRYCLMEFVVEYKLFVLLEVATENVHMALSKTALPATHFCKAQNLLIFVQADSELVSGQYNEVLWEWKHMLEQDAFERHMDLMRIN